MSQVSKRSEDTERDPFEDKPMPRINIDAMHLTDGEKVIVRGIVDVGGRLRETCPELESAGDGASTLLAASTACVWRGVAFYVSPRGEHSRLSEGNFFWFINDGRRRQALSELAQRVAATGPSAASQVDLRSDRLRFDSCRGAQALQETPRTLSPF
jgi:hypothetical protein